MVLLILDLKYYIIIKYKYIQGNILKYFYLINK